MAEIKKKTVKKKAAPKKTARKKGSPRKSTPKKKAPVRKTGKKQSAGNGVNPRTILTIMVLVTVIVFLVNNIYFPGKKKNAKTVTDVKKTGEKVADRGKKSTGEISTRKDIKKPEKRKDAEVDRKIRARIYFVRLNEKTEKSYLSPVRREINGKNPVEGALKELIRGLRPAEERKGFLTAVPEGLKLRRVTMRNRTAELDFGPSLQWGATGHILLNRIDQIVYTATQFDDVDDVIIKINGKRRKTLGGDGLSISSPLRRRRY